MKLNETLAPLRVGHFTGPGDVNIYRVSIDTGMSDITRILSYDMLPTELQVKLGWLNTLGETNVRGVPINVPPPDGFEDIGYKWRPSSHHMEYIVYAGSDTIRYLQGIEQPPIGPVPDMFTDYHKLIKQGTRS